MTFTHSDKIDRVVTNRWLALPIFAFVMWLVYYLSIQTVGTMGTDWLNDVFWGMGSSICGKLVGAMASSAMDAKFNFRWDHCGVGAVLGFLPQLAVLFLCLGF